MRLRRIFRRRPSWRLALCGGLLLFVAARFAYDRPSRFALDGRVFLRGGEAKLIAVQDDGTLLVRQRDEQGRPHDLPVRLLGVTYRLGSGQSATKCLRAELTSPEVRIELDQRRIDDSRRFLAYVSHGGTLLNELVIAEGCATAENYPGDSLSISRRLRAAEQQARRRRRGLWKTAAR